MKTNKKLTKQDDIIKQQLAANLELVIKYDELFKDNVELINDLIRHAKQIDMLMKHIEELRERIEELKQSPRLQKESG